MADPLNIGNRSTGNRIVDPKTSRLNFQSLEMFVNRQFIPIENKEFEIQVRGKNSNLVIQIHTFFCQQCFFRHRLQCCLAKFLFRQKLAALYLTKRCLKCQFQEECNHLTKVLEFISQYFPRLMSQNRPISGQCCYKSVFYKRKKRVRYLPEHPYETNDTEHRERRCITSTVYR